MKDKKVLDTDEIMVDYAEMTSFDFNSLSYREMQALQKAGRVQFFAPKICNK